LLGAGALAVALFAGGCSQGKKLQEAKDLKLLQAERDGAIEGAKKVKAKWLEILREKNGKLKELQAEIDAEAEQFEKDEALAEVEADKTTQEVNRDVRENPMSISCTLSPDALRLRNEAIRKANDPRGIGDDSGGTGEAPGG
jgi:hypothetical protein